MRRCHACPQVPSPLTRTLSSMRSALPPNAAPPSASSPTPPPPAPTELPSPPSSSSAARGDGPGLPRSPSISRSKSTDAADANAAPLSREEQRRLKFEELLDAEVVDLTALKALSWSGIPAGCRAMSWQLLLDYLPPNREWRAATLERKRRDYLSAVPQNFDISDDQRTDYQKKLLHQVLIDVPRTAPNAPVFHHPPVQRCLERILYIWALRHPASGYVQGINDLVTPFFFVFLCARLPDARPATADDVDALPEGALCEIEADAYWCLSKLLDAIQDHYTFAQPGIQRMVFKLSELVARIDAPLHTHLTEQGLQFIQFAFRWMNCLLMRELSLDLIMRLWDTYLAEHGADDSSGGYDSGAGSSGFAVLHVYTCAALLKHYSSELLAMEVSELVTFIQHLPTTGWSTKEVELLLSQAYVFRAHFHASPAHLSGSR